MQTLFESGGAGPDDRVLYFLLFPAGRTFGATISVTGTGGVIWVLSTSASSVAPGVLSTGMRSSSVAPGVSSTGMRSWHLGSRRLV